MEQALVQLPWLNTYIKTGSGSRSFDSSELGGSGDSVTVQKSGSRNNRRKIKVLLENKPFLIAKMDFLQAIVKTYEYDIGGMNESWLYMNVQHFHRELGLQGVRTFSVYKPSLSKNRGGSVY